MFRKPWASKNRAPSLLHQVLSWLWVLAMGVPLSVPVRRTAPLQFDLDELHQALQLQVSTRLPTSDMVLGTWGGSQESLALSELIPGSSANDCMTAESSLMKKHIHSREQHENKLQAYCLGSVYIKLINSGVPTAKYKCKSLKTWDHSVCAKRNRESRSPNKSPSVWSGPETTYQKGLAISLSLLAMAQTCPGFKWSFKT